MKNIFRNCLLDFNEANNVAQWQWVAGCGADAAPYFRIFNPILQGEKFDKEGLYVKKWVPELNKVPEKIYSQTLGDGIKISRGHQNYYWQRLSKPDCYSRKSESFCFRSF